MLKKLGKYMKGLGFLSLISALGMIIEAVCELALPSLANNIYETVNVATSPDQTKAYVLKMGFCMLGLAVIGLCGGLTTMKASAVVSQRFAFRLRNDVYRKISNFSFRNIDKFSTASLTTRLTNDITMLQQVVMMSLRILVRGPALLIVAAVMAVRINPKISATLLIISIMLLKNKNADVSMKDTDDNSGQKAVPINVLLYTILFIIALLVVARVLPWYVLTVLVLVTTFIIERNVLLKADYALLLTFVGFFIFTGNMGRIEPVALFLSGIADGREIGVGIITSQCISNVPAALLLSGFTHNIKNLALGVNIGGLGTLIASMASLISYKQYVNEVPDGKGKYFVTFTVYNVIFLIVLYTCTKFI